jgi:hypothetical protein
VISAVLIACVEMLRRRKNGWRESVPSADGAGTARQGRLGDIHCQIAEGHVRV